MQSVFCGATGTRHVSEDTSTCFVIKGTDVLYKICSWFGLPTSEFVFEICHWKGARWQRKYFNNIESITNVYILRHCCQQVRDITFQQSCSLVCAVLCVHNFARKKRNIKQHWYLLFLERIILKCTLRKLDMDWINLTQGKYCMAEIVQHSNYYIKCRKFLYWLSNY
jgi:hypothetical protein